MMSLNFSQIHIESHNAIYIMGRVRLHKQKIMGLILYYILDYVDWISV